MGWLVKLWQRGKSGQTHTHVLTHRCDAYRMEMNIKLSIKSYIHYFASGNQSVPPKMTSLFLLRYRYRICFFLFFFVYKQGACRLSEQENRNWFFIACLTIISDRFRCRKINFYILRYDYDYDYCYDYDYYYYLGIYILDIGNSSSSMCACVRPLVVWLSNEHAN